MRATLSRTILMSTTAAALSLSAACNRDNVQAPDASITIAITQALTGETTSAGTFALSGARADRGSTTEQLTFGGPLSQSPVPVTFTRTLTGASGTLVVRGAATLTFTSPTAATLAGTWSVQSGTGSYAGVAGSGTLDGAANFGATPPTATVNYAGTLR